MLDATLQAIEADLGISLAPFQIRSAKFLHPARPGDRVLIQFSRTAQGEIKFTCATAGIPVLTGQILCHAPPTAK